MASFGTLQIVLLLAGLALAHCAPTTEETQPDDATDSTSLDVSKVIDSLGKIPAEKIERIRPSLQELANIFKTTPFENLFTYIINQLQNTPDDEEKNPEMTQFIQNLNFNSFIAAIMQLPEDSIKQAQPHFDKLIDELGDTALGKLVREISTILSMRSEVLHFPEIGKETGQNLLNAGADVATTITQGLSPSASNEEGTPSPANMMNRVMGLKNILPSGEEKRQKGKVARKRRPTSLGGQLTAGLL